MSLLGECSQDYSREPLDRITKATSVLVMWLVMNRFLCRTHGELHLIRGSVWSSTPSVLERNGKGL